MHARRRFRSWRLIVTSAVAACVAVTSTSAWATPAETPVPTAGTNGQVWAIADAGDTIYIAGAFTLAGGLPRNYLAAIDAQTGSVTSWDPNASGVVYALAIGPDGSVYAGGKFNAVGGLTRRNIVKLDPDTGAVVTSWNPRVTQGVVRALATGGSQVYIGGTFTRVNASTRNRLAAVDQATGALQEWNPSPTDQVRALDVGPDGTVYAGGFFTGIAGSTRRYVARLDPLTGMSTTFNASIGYPVIALSVVETGVYLGGAGLGGTVGAHDAVTGARRWSVVMDGDVQGIDASATTVYAGGHFRAVRGTTILRRHMASYDIATGALQPWQPNPNGPYGVGPVVVRSDSLLIGGGFTKVNQIIQERFAVLPGTP